MGPDQVDQTVVTTEPAVAAPTQPDALWAPDTLPVAPAAAEPVPAPAAPAPAPAAPAAVVWATSAPAPVAPTAVVWAAPVAAPVAPAAAPMAEAPVAQQTVQTFRRRVTRTSFENAELTRRIVVLVFGLIEVFIGMRVVLLLLDARTTNGLVSGIMSLSGPFVAPFEGILKTNSLSTSGSVLDVAALLALAGWAVVEMIVFWVLATFRREPA
jgi:hypothetical protein